LKFAAIHYGGRLRAIVFPSSPESYVAAGVVVHGVWPDGPRVSGFGASVQKTEIDQVVVTGIERTERER